MSKIIFGLGPLLGGMIFAIGLGVSGMTEPAKIIAFLDLFGNWDPSLAFVMLGAIGVNASLHPLIMKRPNPLFDKTFYLPTKVRLDKNLFIGSGLFGIGWGISGLCPGPGIAGLHSGQTYTFLFVLFMLTGMVVTRWTQSRRGS